MTLIYKDTVMNNAMFVTLQSTLNIKPLAWL